MSYIYDALKRAEEERQSGPVTVRAVGRPAFFAARARWWIWALLGALGVNAALLATLVEINRAPSSSATGGRSESTIGAVVVPPRSDDATSATKPASPIERAAPVTTPIAPRIETRSPAARPSAPAERERPRETPPAATAPARPAPRAESTMTTEGPASAIERGTSTERAAPPVASSAPTGAPSPTASDPRAKLALQVLVYSDIPSQRMVFIDGRRYREGDTIDADTVLERITPEGAVLNRGGQRFVLTDRRQ